MQKAPGDREEEVKGTPESEHLVQKASGCLPHGAGTAAYEVWLARGEWKQAPESELKCKRPQGAGSEKRPRKGLR